METPDHKNPNSSGHGGGHHVCHRCGWPYPNAHPSSKNRRAHKKVCGTIDKYRLDDNALEKPHDGEQHSDDEFESPSDKGVKGTISRRSSSGVGSRSSRSNRSEDEVFTDAVTEFNENPAGEASGGAIQRFYSIQNENERDDTERAEENPIAGADNLNQTDHFKDNKLETDENVVADKVDSGMASQDQISTDPSLVSAVVTSEIETTIDPKIDQSCDPSGELDTVPKRGEEIKTNKDESSLETSSGETLVETADVRDLQGACDIAHGDSGEHLAPISANALMKTSLSEDVVGDNDGRFDVLDSSEREETKEEKTESSNEAISPGDLYPPVHLGEAVNSGNGNLSKSERFEERDSKIGSSDSVYALLGSDVLPLEQHPEIEVEDSNHISSKNSVSVAPDPTADFMDHGKGCSVESGSDAAFIQTNDGDSLFSEDSSARSLEKKHDNQKYVDEQKTCEEPYYRTDVESSDADLNISKSEGVDDLKSKNLEVENDSDTKEKKPITSLENTFPEGAAIDALKTTSNVDSTRSDVEDDGEYITVMDTVGSKVPEDDLAVKNSASILPSRDEVAVSSDENIKVEGVTLSENVTSDGATPDRISDLGKVDRVLDSGDMIVGHTQGENVFTSQCAEELGNSDKIVQTENIVADDATVSTLKTDGLLNSTSKVEVDADADAKSSESNDKVAEDTSRVTEGDRVIKQPATNSAADAIADSGSLSDSLDGNWGSVSVMSTTSDALPTADTITSNLPRSLEGEGPSMEPKPVLEDQHSQNQVPVNPEVGIQQPEHASEIHPSNEPIRGKKDKEIIDKVSNWDSGKQNTPLKTLLGEATARSRAESPIHHYQTSSSTSVLKTDTIPGTNDGLSAKTENVILKSDHSEMETAAHDETGKEWNSPARYPVNIKTEKRRSKRTYWAPFLCCSSVNAR